MIYLRIRERRVGRYRGYDGPSVVPVWACVIALLAVALTFGAGVLVALRG